MKILIPVDGSEHSMEALKVGLDFAKSKDANLCLINVMPYIEFIDLEISAAEQEKLKEKFKKRADYIVQQACGILAAEDVISACRTVVSSASVPDAIVENAKQENADLIIIGSRGLGPSSTFKMGSVSSKVVKHSPCSVYVVKLPDK
jgi:nucleotide-binding universal stress UspA family protein